MDWLLERPLFIVMMGLMTAAVMGGIWLQGGRTSALYGFVVCLVVTTALLVLEHVVETDREQIEATLRLAARCIERNDIEAALRYTHSQADWIRRQARAELPRYDFQQVTIKSNLDVSVDSDANPPKATATFSAVAVLSERDGIFKNNRIPRYVVVEFLKEDNQWRAVNYEHHEPQRAFMNHRSR